MNTYESSATPPTGPSNSAQAREIGSSSSRSPTQTGSALSFSADSRSHSSSSSRKSSRKQQTIQQSTQQSNEATPIFNSGSNSRNYQSTEAPGAPYGLKEAAKDGKTNAPAPAPDVNTTDTTAQNQQDDQSEDAGPRQAWYSGFVQRLGSLELENKGSVARDHLALERTFLAWMRTSLAFASIGIAVTQLFRLNTTTASTKTAPTHPQTAHPEIQPPHGPHTLLDIFTAPQSPTSTVRLRSVGKPLGSTFIGVAIVILIVGFHRYFESQYWIVRGKFPASRGSVALTAFVAFALIVAALAVILAVSPGAFER